MQFNIFVFDEKLLVAEYNGDEDLESIRQLSGPRAGAIF